MAGVDEHKMAEAVATALTDQQRAAVVPNGCSIALSAGAGCGKTRVLTERFLWHLAPGADHLGIHRLAALTFTDRAAREMRDRIRRRCHERMVSCPEPEVGHWKSVLQGLEAARISTIHAFCATVLRGHAVQAGLDPRFTVADESTAGALLHRVVEQTLFDRLAAGDSDAEGLVLRRGVGPLVDWLASLAAECDPRALQRWEGVTADELAEGWRRQWEEDGLRREVRRLVGAAETQELLKVLSGTRCGNTVMEQRRAWLVQQVPTLAEGPALLDRLRELPHYAVVRGGGGQRAWPTPEVYAQVRDGLGRLREAARRLWDVSCRDEAATAEAAAQGTMLLRLAVHVTGAYERAKAEATLVDFRDLLVKTRELLSAHPAARERLAGALPLILVDEFQDTDPVQVEILRLLCGEALSRQRLFIVGDSNQAIYRFRGADPHLFAQLREEIPAKGRKSITKNFRSQPAVLQFVNRLFGETFGPGYEPLDPQMGQTTAVPNVEFAWTKVERNDVKRQGRRFEAQSIARRIREMLETGEPKVVDRAETADGAVPTLRAPRMGDVALLFRALSDVRYYEEALRREGLAYYLVGGYGFFAQQEIWDLLNVLRAVEDPDDAVSLAGALRSPLFSLRDETLYWLADGRGDLEGGLHDDSRWAQMDRQQRRRVRYAAEVIDELRGLKDRLPLSELMQRLFDRTGYDAILLSEFLGPRKLANLRKIRNTARQFDAAGLFTLADFIAHLEDSVARQPREDQAATHPEKSNVVRLMTIHQAKGLEFPIVFVPDLGRKEQYGPRGAVLHPEVGPVVPAAARAESHLGMELYKVLEREEEQREEQRLFYVACTRAADYLVLCSSLVDVEKSESLWMRLLAERFDLASGKAYGVSGDERADAKVVIVDGGEASHEGPRPRRSAGARRLPNWSKVVQEVEASGAGSRTLPKAVAAVAPALERRRQFVPSEIAAAGQRRLAREELPLFRVPQGEAPTEVDEIVVMEGEPGEGRDGGPAPHRSAAARVGTVVHAVLRNLDLEQLRAGYEAGQLERLVAQCAVDVDPLDNRVDLRQVTELVGGFLGGPLASALAQSRVCHRELEFLLRWTLEGERNRKRRGDRSPQRYLRGFLDCVYQDGQGGWHVVDYKTDAVEAQDVPERAERYRLQLAIYALAAQRQFGRLDSAQLYFLRPGVAWELEVGGAWEDRVAGEIEAAIDELAVRADVASAGLG